MDSGVRPSISRFLDSGVRPSILRFCESDFHSLLSVSPVSVVFLFRPSMLPPRSYAGVWLRPMSRRVLCADEVKDLFATVKLPSALARNRDAHPRKPPPEKKPYRKLCDERLTLTS